MLNDWLISQGAAPSGPQDSCVKIHQRGKKIIKKALTIREKKEETKKNEWVDCFSNVNHSFVFLLGKRLLK